MILLNSKNGKVSDHAEEKEGTSRWEEDGKSSEGSQEGGCEIGKGGNQIGGAKTLNTENLRLLFHQR